MAQYKSFDKTKHKIQTVWEKNQANLSEIDNQNIKKLEVSFRSENQYKPVSIIPVTSNLEVAIANPQLSVSLINWPDWVLNMIHPKIVFNLDSAYKPNEEILNFNDAHDEGTLKLGDISIGRFNHFYWFTKQDGLYKLNFKFDLGVFVVDNISEIGWSSSIIPTFVNISLYVLNERNYNELQSG